MKKRDQWVDRIRRRWKERSVIWLSGVRRVGKTTLSRMIPDALYMNCDLPSVCRRLEEPEFFFDGLDQRQVVIFDEVHRLTDPSRLLKIAADVYPQIRVLATASSTLSATRKFRDSLTGRKVSIYLPPVLWEECPGSFGVRNLDRRLLHGGLPEPLLSKRKSPALFADWIDSFYARDISELFAIRQREGFMKLLSLLLRQSAGQIDYSRLANLSDLSRPTVKAHIEAMQIAHAVYMLPPFHGGGRREITRMPKCYAFDTGFVTFAKGWRDIRDEDRGLLWEHLVLDTLRVCVNAADLFYWRDKSRREIDFVIRRDRQVDAVECKVNPERFEPESLINLRTIYPRGRNYVVSPLVKESYQRQIEKMKVTFVSTAHLRQEYE